MLVWNQPRIEGEEEEEEEKRKCLSQSSTGLDKKYLAKKDCRCDQLRTMDY